MILGRDIDQRLAAQLFDMADAALGMRSARPRRHASSPRCSGRMPSVSEDRPSLPGIQEIHLRTADEAGDKGIVGIVIQVHRLAHLFDPPARRTTILSASVIASTWSWVT